MEVAAMAIHAPAHRPAYQFHFALPHVDGSSTGIVMLIVGVVVMLALTWGAMARQASVTTTEPYQAAVSAAAYDGSAMIQRAQARLVGTEAQSLLLFRAGERGTSIGAEAQSLLTFRAGERAATVPTEAQSLLTFRSGERAPLADEAASLVLFRAGERESR
jgi:hypothetical protein